MWFVVEGPSLMHVKLSLQL